MREMKKRGNMSQVNMQIGQMMGAIYIGIARAALNEGIEYIETKARPWIHSGVSKASDDPHVVHRVGAMDIAIDAAEAALGAPDPMAARAAVRELLGH